MNEADIHIKDLWAIKDADIKLNGINVIAGVNGCGKSTMSRLLYYVYNNVNNYQHLVYNKYRKSASKILEIYEQISSSFQQLDSYKTFSLAFYNSKKQEQVRNILQKAENLLLDFIEKDQSKEIVDRLISIIAYNLNLDKDNKADIVKSILPAYDSLIDKLNADRVNRPVSILDEETAVNFNFKSLLNNLTIKEYGVPVYGKDVKSVPLLHYIQKAVYINSPLLIDYNGDTVSDYYESDMYKALRIGNSTDKGNEIASFIKDIIKGKASISDETDEVLFQRNDGKVFSMQQCATGIKSFALLQLLLSTGNINDRTLVIWDEPEAHLHPQWIVEFARTVIMINKEVNAKFFLATHSTDLVSALRYIAEKKGMLGKLSYYQAQQDKDDSFRYTYNSLGTNIEPIFGSFNKSLELIDKYGGYGE